MSKANICIIGLLENFVDKYSFEISKKLDMFYANVSQIVEFELFDLHKMEELLGKDYINKEESSILKRICSYDNTLMNVNYSILNNEKNLQIVKENCLLIYLKLKKSRFEREQDKENISDSLKLINSDLFKDRDYLCSIKADICVDCENLEDNRLVDKVFTEILNYYN